MRLTLFGLLISLGCGSFAVAQDALRAGGTATRPSEATSVAETAALRVVGERRIALTIDSGGADVSVIYGWVSTDHGRNWKGVGHSTEVKPPIFRFEAPEDGHYDFYFVLENAAGRSGSPPAAGAPPHASVLVDTREPIVQLHGAARELALPRTWRFRASIIDDNLGPNGIRVFYRGAGSELWRDGGPASYAGGSLLWTAGEDLPERFDMRVIATDRAGHRGMSDLSGILVPLRETRHVTTSQPAAELAADKSADAMLPKPVAAATPATRPSAEPKALDAETARLVELATYFRERGQFDVATARLKSALARAPDNVDILSALGGDLASAQHWDEARAQYERAHELEPTNVDALEGLALVAVQERQYAKARDLLHTILGKQPESSATWLRLGDVQFRLGEKADAVTAWKRAAETAGKDEAARKRAEERVKQFGATGPRP